MKGETLKGHLEMLLLASVEGSARHGYSIIEELRKRTGDLVNLAEGTVYPVLHRMEAGGLLKSRWLTGDGRKRRVYSLTRKGAARLQKDRENWQRFATVVQRVIGEVRS